MTDYADLKAKAEAAKAEWLPGRWFTDSDDRWEDFDDEDAAFMVAAAPDVVLSLLAENERLRAALEDSKAALIWSSGGWRSEGLPEWEMTEARETFRLYLEAIDATLQEGRPA